MISRRENETALYSWWKYDKGLESWTEVQVETTAKILQLVGHRAYPTELHAAVV